MKIYYIKDETDLISVNIKIPRGILHERFLHGAAHLIEHLLFHGHSDLEHDEIIEYFENNGGVINASVDLYSTIIYFRIGKEYVDDGIRIILNCIDNFKINSDSFLNEMEKIRNENLINSANRIIFNKTLENAFSNFHCLYEINFSFSDMMEYYKCNYSTKFLTILILGQWKNKIFKCDGKMEREVSILERSTNFQKKIIEINSEFNFVSSLCIINGVDAEIQLRIWKSYLTSGFSSILNRILVNELRCTYQIQFWKNIMIKNNSMIISFFNSKKKDKEKITQNLVNSFEKIELDDKMIDEIRLKTILEIKLLYENRGRFAKFILENLNFLNELKLFQFNEIYESSSEKILNVIYEMVNPEYIKKTLLNNNFNNEMLIVFGLHNKKGGLDHGN